MTFHVSETDVEVLGEVLAEFPEIEDPQQLARIVLSKLAHRRAAGKGDLNYMLINDQVYCDMLVDANTHGAGE